MSPLPTTDTFRRTTSKWPVTQYLRGVRAFDNQIFTTRTREEKTLAITNTLAGRNFGMILLAIWLILTGIIPLLAVRISSTINMALAVLAIAAGVLILLRR